MIAASRLQGSQALLQLFEQEIAALGLEDEVSVSTISDVGRSDVVPLVSIYPEAVVYGPVKAQDVHWIVEEHLFKGRVVESLLAPKRELSGRIAWLAARKGTMPAEQRIVLKRSGLIDPEDIEEYIIHDGYKALAKALTEMTPQQVIDELIKSGLQGRGGAGFPVGKKWSFVAAVPEQPKYVVCNADESEPGTFKDRVILESDPHSIVEAMTMAGYAVGAHEGYIYIRGEYGLAQQRFAQAIEQAHEYGMLGKNIFGSGFDFEIHLHSGAGAYICGEETALIESIEGKRGEPRSRPPYPTTNGLWGKPTLVNNVETLANVPPILRNGAAWYHQFGTPSSPGTKGLHHLGQCQPDRSDRSPDGHHPARSDQYLCERDEKRRPFQAGANRRLKRFDHPRQPAGHPHGFRLLQQSRRFARLGRAADLR